MHYSLWLFTFIQFFFLNCIYFKDKKDKKYDEAESKEEEKGEEEKSSKKWTIEKDDLLRNYFKSYEGNWKRIAKEINKKIGNNYKTTSSECIKRWNSLNKKLKLNKWKQEEEDLLIALVNYYGQNWK